MEWIRAHHGNWLVDEIEHVWYSWHAPQKGGPQLKSLPSVGLSPAATNSGPTTPPVQAAVPWPPPIKPVFPHPLPGEGIWKRTSPLIDGGPRVLVTTFRSERAYPRIVAYVAWFDHTRTAGSSDSSERCSSPDNVTGVLVMFGGLLAMLVAVPLPPFRRPREAAPT